VTVHDVLVLPVSVPKLHNFALFCIKYHSPFSGPVHHIIQYSLQLRAIFHTGDFVGDFRVIRKFSYLDIAGDSPVQVPDKYKEQDRAQDTALGYA
jgi:hypothetical protein